MKEQIIFSITADVCCLLLCVIALLIVFLWGNTLGKQGRYAKYVFSSHGAQILFNLLGLIFKGGTKPYTHSVLMVTNFMEFASGYVLSYFIICYIIICVEKGNELCCCRKIAGVAGGAAIILLTISQFTGIYYTIDAANFYHRSVGYPISLLFPIFSLALILIITIRYRCRLDKTERMAIFVYMFLPTVALAIQPFIYGIYIILLVNTAALVIMFLMMHYVQIRKFYENEIQLSQMQISVMLSQIQPHFLYNSLNTICYLCKSDPDAAQKAVNEFATYLRGNLDSLKHTQPIPMEKELEHVRTYLSLEKLRFEEKLHIIWDIQSTDFNLPALTVQPLVENAVKYGVGKKENGGTVTISSREKSDRFEVCVSDNGVGFDPYKTQEDGRTHIGIDNVNSRLISMCHASLSIDSKPGIGTCATIQIPKE